LPASGDGSGGNSIEVKEFAVTLARYAPRLRGFTCYPDGSRGGQPLTAVPYRVAKQKLGQEFDEHLEANDPCEGGVCGV
jgi:ribonucleoside-diphosphate reductase alpha chain